MRIASEKLILEEENYTLGIKQGSNILISQMTAVPD